MELVMMSLFILLFENNQATVSLSSLYLKGHAHVKIIKKSVIFFGFLISPYDVNMSID